MAKMNSKREILRALQQGEDFELDEKLIELDLSGMDFYPRNVEPMAKAIRDNTTLQSLTIDRNFTLAGVANLIEALKENMSITRFNIREKNIYNDHELEKWRNIQQRINDLVGKNKAQQQALNLLKQDAIKHHEEEKAKRQQEEELDQQREVERNIKRDQEIARQSAWQAEKLRLEEERKKQRDQQIHEDNQSAALKAWIDTNNWEAVAAFIKEHSDFAITDFLSAGKYNLNTVTFISQLSAHTVQRTIEEFEGVQTILATKSDELSSQYQLLEQEAQDLKRKLEEVGGKLKQVTEEIQAAKVDLDVKPSQITKAKDNLKAIQDSLVDKIPKLKQWKERLQTDVLQWTDHDVEFLLQELDMSNHSSKFLKNKIDGSVLLDLATSDLIDTLSVTFKEAKRLLKSVFLAQMYKDIYTTPPGVLQWHVDTVCSWLEDNKFAHLTDIFRKQQITGSELAFIDRNDLKKYLKIEALGDCIKLEKVIKQLQQSHLADRSIQKQIAVEMKEEKIAGHMSELEHKLLEMKTVNEELKLKLKNAKRDAPEAFSCPITQEIMSDPVVANDGHTYERVAIEAWLLHHDTSPMTNQRLDNKTLTPSHTLKSMIREFVDRK